VYASYPLSAIKKAITGSLSVSQNIVGRRLAKSVAREISCLLILAISHQVETPSALIEHITSKIVILKRLLPG